MTKNRNLNDACNNSCPFRSACKVASAPWSPVKATECRELTAAGHNTVAAVAVRSTALAITPSELTNIQRMHGTIRALAEAVVADGKADEVKWPGSIAVEAVVRGNS